MTTAKLLKVAWIREPDAPQGFPGKGKLKCPCGNAPLTDYQPSPDVICSCGRRYTWDGFIKGRSIGSPTLTGYRVIYEDGTYYSTDMAEHVTLEQAARYFVGQTFDGKLVADVEPCEMKTIKITPQPGQVYEFVNYDGKPATLQVVKVTDQHIWYKWTGTEALHTYPMAIELWNEQEYKLVS